MIFSLFYVFKISNVILSNWRLILTKLRKALLKNIITYRVIWGEELKSICIYSPKNMKFELFPFCWDVFSKKGKILENKTFLILFYLSDNRIKFKTEAAYFLSVKAILF